MHRQLLHFWRQEASGSLSPLTVPPGEYRWCEMQRAGWNELTLKGIHKSCCHVSQDYLHHLCPPVTLPSTIPTLSSCHNLNIVHMWSPIRVLFRPGITVHLEWLIFFQYCEWPSEGSSSSQMEHHENNETTSTDFNLFHCFALLSTSCEKQSLQRKHNIVD